MNPHVDKEISFSAFLFCAFSLLSENFREKRVSCVSCLMRQTVGFFFRVSKICKNSWKFDDPAYSKSEKLSGKPYEVEDDNWR